VALNTSTPASASERSAGPDTRITLGDLLLSRGLSSKDLAWAIDTYESTVSRWRNGIVPSKENRDRIYAVTGATEDEIAALGWEKEMANA